MHWIVNKIVLLFDKKTSFFLGGGRVATFVQWNMLQSTTALCNVSEKMRPYQCVTFICSLERSTIYISYTNMVGIRDTNFLFAKTLTLSGICFVLSTIHRSIMNSFNFNCVHLLADLFFSWGLKKNSIFIKPSSRQTEKSSYSVSCQDILMMFCHLITYISTIACLLYNI